MPDELSHRWNWINAFLTAALNAAIAYSSKTPGQIPGTLGEFITDYVNTARRGLKAPFPAITLKPGELEYVFHLESELWGSDWKHYVHFFATKGSRSCQPLQTFHFALAFFTIERCLALFLPAQQRLSKSGRTGRRRDLFGWEHGVFSVQYPHCLEVMGPPFFLCADRRQANAVGTATTLWSDLARTPVPPELQQFYLATSRHEHFTQILETAFVQARVSYLTKALPRRGKKRLPPGTRAWWYDVLWRYSESIRYGDLVPTSEACQRPFFWNRSVRWFTSLTITGLLTIAAESEPSVRNIWESCRRKNPVLGGVFEGVARL